MKVAFIGQLPVADEGYVTSVRSKVEKIVEKLITENGADEFVFGSTDNFGMNMCYDIVTRLKEKYPHIRRLYRYEYSKPSKKLQKKLNKDFESWECPATNREMGQFPYIKSNELMISECDLLITYYDKNIEPSISYYEQVRITLKNNDTLPMSEMKLALNYAFRNDKEFINVFEDTVKK